MLGPCWRQLDPDRRLLCSLLFSRGKKWTKRFDRQEQTKEVREYVKRNRRRRENLDLKRMADASSYEYDFAPQKRRHAACHDAYEGNVVTEEQVWSSVVNHGKASRRAGQKAWIIWKQQQQQSPPAESEAGSASSTWWQSAYQQASDSARWHRADDAGSPAGSSTSHAGTWSSGHGSSWHSSRSSSRSAGRAWQHAEPGRTGGEQGWQRSQSRSSWLHDWQQHWDESAQHHSWYTYSWRQQQHAMQSTGALCKHRKTLGLPQHGALDHVVLKEAFRTCALAYHPDRHQDSASQAEAEARFKLAQEAYQFLQKSC